MKDKCENEKEDKYFENVKRRSKECYWVQKMVKC